MADPEVFTDARLLSILSLHFGYDTFRPRQLDAIKTVLSGNDCLLVLPTGGGKSMTFMLPAVASQRVSVIVTPLLALAKDQVENANDCDIEAASWSSQTSEKQKAALARELVSEDGSLRVLYTTPESLQTERLLDILTTAHAENRLCMLAVDEAHAVSEWGHDFRPSYLTLRDFRSKFPGLPCLAVTATATPRVRSSIIHYLDLSNPNILLGSFNRPELQFSVVYKEILLQKQKQQQQEQKKKKKKPMLVPCSASSPTAAAGEEDNNCKSPHEEDTSQQQQHQNSNTDSDNEDTASDPIVSEVIRFIQERPGQSGIVYCRLRVTCDQVASALCCADIDAASYHAGLDPERRSKVQNDWKHDGYAVVVATIAFGMGIDKPDVRYVLHVDPPASLEGLYQEAGRGGRDGQPAVSVVFASNEDLKKAQKMEKGERAGSTAAVAGYIHHAGCRRQALLAHFSEKRGPCCAKDGEQLCDYCQSPGAVASQLAKVDELCNADARASAAAAEEIGGGGGGAENRGHEEDPYDRVDPGSDTEEEEKAKKESNIAEQGSLAKMKNAAAGAAVAMLPAKRKPSAPLFKPLVFVQKAESKENGDKIDALQHIEEQTAEKAAGEAVAVKAAVASMQRRPFTAPRRVEN